MFEKGKLIIIKERGIVEVKKQFIIA